jgi:protein-disulfide isomerase
MIHKRPVIIGIMMTFLVLLVLPVALESTTLQSICVRHATAQDSPCQEAESTIVALEEQVFELEATNAALEAALSEFAIDIPPTPVPPISDSSGRDYSQIPQTRTDDGAFLLGDEAAPITIVEFADFTCPHCQVYEETISRLIDEYVVTGQARLEFRMYPFFDPQYAAFTAQLAECIDDLLPGSFWRARDLIFELSAEERYEEMPRYVAKTFDLEEEALLECALDAQQYVTDSAVARTMEVQGTPAVMIRYNGGPMIWIERDGETFNRGGVAYSVLSEVILDVQ